VLAAPLVAMISVRALTAQAPALIAAAFIALAGGSSLLALANGPVGPSDYSPGLAELRPQLGPDSIVVVAPDELLDDEHGVDYLNWELRGNRLCVIGDGEEAPAGVARTLAVSVDDSGAVVPEGTIENEERPGSGPGRCPLIPSTGRAQVSGG